MIVDLTNRNSLEENLTRDVIDVWCAPFTEPLWIHVSFHSSRYCTTPESPPPDAEECSKGSSSVR